MTVVLVALAALTVGIAVVAFAATSPTEPSAGHGLVVAALLGITVWALLIDLVWWLW